MLRLRRRREINALAIVAEAVGFVAVSLAGFEVARRWIDRVLDWLPREFFLLALLDLSSDERDRPRAGLSEAIGALMAGVVLSETSVRGEIERFFSFRDVFAALSLSSAWPRSTSPRSTRSADLAGAVVVTVVGKIGGTLWADASAASRDGRASMPVSRS